MCCAVTMLTGKVYMYQSSEGFVELRQKQNSPISSISRPFLFDVSNLVLLTGNLTIANRNYSFPDGLAKK